ncbi:hypothetical protein B0O99DRAFT_669633 [Bisporella sp. PMI_857]|nr:hypothetical protein B0O99DRAFT_669633 [Bisporella sp. PMI_857]
MPKMVRTHRDSKFWGWLSHINIEPKAPGLVDSGTETDKQKRKRLAAEEKATAKCTRICPQCRVTIFRESGCDAMICHACQCKFCWRCKKEKNSCRCFLLYRYQGRVAQPSVVVDGPEGKMEGGMQSPRRNMDDGGGLRL